MNMRLRAHLRTALFVLGGAGAGLAYYAAFGCAGSCAITSSPLRTMVYFAIIGRLLSAILEQRREG